MHAPPASGTPDPPRPLVVTDDPELLDDLLRLSAAAAVEVTVAHTPAHAGRDWSRAPLVVAGSDLLPAIADLEPRPHRNVVAAGRDGIRYAAPDHPAGAAARRIGARAVFSLPEDEAALAELFAESTRPRSGHAPVLSVVGSRGGAGASLLAVALALGGARAGLSTALIDADPLGVGLDVLLGEEHAPGTRWGGLLGRQGRMDWAAVRSALPVVRGVALLTWERGPTRAVPTPAMRAVLTSAAHGADLVVADLPRALDAGAQEALQRTTTALLVVPAALHAVVAARRITPRLRDHVADLRVVTRGADADLPASDIARALRLPLAGDIADERGLPSALDRGDTPADHRGSPLAGFADGFLARLRAEAAAEAEPGAEADR
ncbi:secretion/DNA translocation related CpaE-like protein [Nocardiopsis mwathae]|uniref:Secretion/DNA translocation related CpaE-like protein n=1 Tax=Nocardiopsis mwathae TaxID=1472723 RepID=A0A7X0D7W3_9ACTN|nr:septum site-determining protein Ssd [Nocardiopsis mwathae]MBB6174156.1 secretion/DNA translocation related CpaE-like protein [Nocardiopsis mwathae]